MFDRSSGPAFGSLDLYFEIFEDVLMLFRYFNAECGSDLVFGQRLRLPIKSDLVKPMRKPAIGRGQLRFSLITQLFRMLVLENWSFRSDISKNLV